MAVATRTEQVLPVVHGEIVAARCLIKPFSALPARVGPALAALTLGCPICTKGQDFFGTTGRVEIYLAGASSR